jgi:hypothetical protein
MRTKIIAGCSLFIAASLCLFAVATPTPAQERAKKKWPKNRDEAQGAVDSFSEALSQAGHDQAVRDRLKTTPESARDTVSDPAVGNIDIPKNVLIIFHEPKDCKNYYPFYLPKPGSKVDDYWLYFQGCFSKFQLRKLSEAKITPPPAGKKMEWNQDNIAKAFTDVLKLSATDKAFRKRLTGLPDQQGTSAALQSAKEAVADVGNIEIPAEIVIFFHEDVSNERYHMFYLPPFDSNTQTKYEYRAHFEGVYFVW